MPYDTDPAAAHAPELTRVPMPEGGFQDNESEADWLAKTITLRTNEGIESMGLGHIIVAQDRKTGLYDLILLCMNSASRRGAKAASAGRSS